MSVQRIIARLDIKGDNLVKGIHLEGLRVLGKPWSFAKYYYENGADELIFQDVVASLYGRNGLNEIVTQTAKEIFIPLTVGGGIRTVEELDGVRRQAAWFTSALIVVALGMIGLPPTGGFFGKWYIILGALEANNYVAVAAVLLSTLLTLGYFIRIFESIFRQTPISAGINQSEIPFSLKLSVGVTSAAVLLLGLLSDPIVLLLLTKALPPGL